MTITNSPSEPWQAIAARKREEAAKKIPVEWKLPSKYTDGISETSTASVLHVPKECGLLSARELEITEKYDAVDLIKAISTARFTALEVTVAFCKRAAIAQQLVSFAPSIYASLTLPDTMSD